MPPLEDMLMRALKDNIYEILSQLDPAVARAWRQNYVPPAPYASPAQEMQGAVLYFFQAFSSLQGDYTHELNCITGNANNMQNWLADFANVIAPSFIHQSRFIFAPKRDIAENVSELGSLIGAY